MLRKTRGRTEPQRIRLSVAIWIAAGVGLTTAVISAVIVVGIDRTERAPLGAWLSDFAKSPGLAGLCALLAASLTLWGILRQVATSRRGIEHQQEAESNRAWWERFEWAATRAVPASKDDNPLPFGAVLSTLTALTEAAKDDVQRTAIGAVMEVAADKSNEPTNENELPAYEEVPPAGDRTIQALQNYVRAAGNTPARSAMVEAHLYEYQVIEALKRLLSPENVRIQPLLSPENVHIPRGLRMPDAVVTHREKLIVIEVKAYRKGRGLGSEAAAQIRPLIEMAGADAGLVVAPIELQFETQNRERDNILGVAWVSPEDDAVLLRALNILAGDREPGQL